MVCLARWNVTRHLQKRLRQEAASLIRRHVTSHHIGRKYEVVVAKTHITWERTEAGETQEYTINQQTLLHSKSPLCLHYIHELKKQTGTWYFLLSCPKLTPIVTVTDAHTPTHTTHRASFPQKPPFSLDENLIYRGGSVRFGFGPARPGPEPARSPSLSECKKGNMKI